VASLRSNEGESWECGSTGDYCRYLHSEFIAVVQIFIKTFSRPWDLQFKACPKQILLGLNCSPVKIDFFLFHVWFINQFHTNRLKQIKTLTIQCVHCHSKDCKCKQGNSLWNFTSCRRCVICQHLIIFLCE